MPIPTIENSKIAVIGLGYVGLPLAIKFARQFPVVGYDLDADRVDELARSHDRTGEAEETELSESRAVLTSDPEELTDCNIFIITVPTPVDNQSRPDLTAVRSACETVGAALSPGAVVVVESTVYPGVTEDVCGVELEHVSSLRCGEDFFLGYSPERINPGDREHTVDKITKVVAGQTREVTELLSKIYGAITAGGIFVTRDIRTAEAAKVIENAQRDINIAFINEVAQIFDRMGIDSLEVLEAANTKWNFMDFRPGLVGGHCIGVDPFYLAHAAEQVDHDPEVILAGRRINDGMAGYVARRIAEQMSGGPPGRILVLGLTFKENVPDLRNSKVAELVQELSRMGFEVDVHDPLADREQAQLEWGLALLEALPGEGRYECVVGAVAHSAYAELRADGLEELIAHDGLLVDLKGIWRGVSLPDSIRRWSL